MRPLKVVIAVALLAPLALTAACSSSSPIDASNAGSVRSSACQPAAAGSKVQLTFASWVPKMQEIVNLWNSKNPDIQVKYSDVPAGPGGTYANNLNQLKAGSAGDIGFVDYAEMSTFATVGGLTDIAACPGVKESESKFVPWTVSQSRLGQKGDAIYGLPHDIAPIGLFYRKDLFDKAGIAVPTTWDEFYEAAKKVRAAGGYITNLPNGNMSGLLEGLAWQNGARWFTNDGQKWSVNLTDPATMKVAEFWQKLISEHLVSTYPLFQDAFNKAFADGKVWSNLLGAWGGYYMSSGAPKTTGKWGVAETPVWTAGDKTNGNWGGADLVVWKTSKHPAEAAKFMLWVVTDPQAVALNVKNGAIFPATAGATTAIPALGQPQPFFGGQKTWLTFAQAANKVDPTWSYGPVQLSTDKAIDDGVTQVLAGSGTLGDVLKSAQDKTVQTMKQQSIPVTN